jgi:hypothetical protein
LVSRKKVWRQFYKEQSKGSHFIVRMKPNWLPVKEFLKSRKEEITITIRRGIEEGYKMYKARVQVEAFSGRTAISAKQDMYVKAMMMTLCAALAFPIEERVVKEYKADQKKGRVKHPHKINRTFAYWSTKGILIGMFIKRLIRSALAAFDKLVEANTEIIRPGKRNPRPKKPPRHSYMNYKDI